MPPAEDGRAWLTGSSAGIAPTDVPYFIVAQLLCGAPCAPAVRSALICAAARGGRLAQAVGRLPALGSRVGAIVGRGLGVQKSGIEFLPAQRGMLHCG